MPESDSTEVVKTSEREMVSPSGTPADDTSFLTLALEFSGSLDGRTVMRRILERVIRMSGADRATLSSISAETLRIEASAGTDGEISWSGMEFPHDYLFSQPLVRRMLETRHTVLGGPLELTTAAEQFRDALARTRHTAMVPLLDAGEPIGMLVLSRTADQPFAAADVPRLTALGALAGLALTNAKNYERARDTGRRLESAVRAASDIGMARDVPALLEQIVSRAADAAGGEAASVMRIDGDQLIIQATSGIAQTGTRFPLPDAAAPALAAGRPIQLSMAGLEVPDDLKPVVSQYGHSLLLPLMYAGETLGVLVIGRITGQPRFTDDDIVGVQQFASLAALLLSNARLLEEVREAERTKREFLDIAVHELRNPLSVVEGYASLLREGTYGELSAGALRALSSIEAKSAEARELASALLAVARIESRDLRVGAERLVVAALLDDAARRAMPRIELAKGSLIVACPTDVQITGDADLVARILDNLVGNAIQYAESAPELRFDVGRGDRGTEIRLRDNGPGVSDRESERIFERFVRGAGSQSAPGTGLGLYISRECARRMGGDLVLETTQPGVGSVFLLTLPSGGV